LIVIPPIDGGVELFLNLTPKCRTDPASAYSCPQERRGKKKNGKKKEVKKQLGRG
jgi:hypothetical protein